MTLFAFFALWWATAAVGAGAVAIPVIIHLINRRRFKIVPWAAMKFLLAAQKQTRKRMRIEQLLLLFVRMLILAAIVVAMAAVLPWAEQIWAALHISKLGQGNTHRTHRIHHIFVLDASLSMNQKVDGERTAFDVARERAIKKIDSNPSGDAYSVLILKDSPTWLVGEASQNARKVIKELETVKASHGNASVTSALSMISTKLGEAKGRFPAQAVYFFTDMQRANWAAAAPSTSARGDSGDKERSGYLEIQNKVKGATFFVDCGPSKDSPNLAVTSVEFDLNYVPYVTAGMDMYLKATIENFAAEDKKELRAEVLIGKARESADEPAMQMRIVDQETATIPAHEKREFAFTKVKFPSPGTYAVQVRIGEDALLEDNSRTIIITVRDTIPILLVNGKASAVPFERATEYLRLALNPFPAGAEVKGFPLRPTVVTPTQFSDMPEAELEKYDCVYWCDVGQFGVNDLRKIDTHLRRGGGFIVTLGDQAVKSLDRYNDLLYKNEQGLLPAKLMKMVAAPADHHFYFQNTDDMAFAKPPLSAFVDKQDQLTLKTARFRKYVFSHAIDAKARTVLSFATEVANLEKVKRDDTLPINAPAIVEWNPPLKRAQDPGKDSGRFDRQLARYRGKVILFTSTVNMDWNSWPGSPSYGAMMHELTRLAVSGRLREQRQSVGDQVDAFLPGGAEFDVTVHMPNKALGVKKVKTQLIDDVNLFRFDETDISGIYRVETSKGYDLPFAVNVPAGSMDQKGTESDLARIDEARLAELFPDWTFKVITSALDAVITGNADDSIAMNIPQPVGPEIANVLLLLVLGLLFLEIVLAWMFGHYTTTEGALTNAPAGPASTTVAAGIAIFATILFAVGLFVVADYWWTGDFLGFVPDLIRTWVERRIGVEDLNPGEGSNWTYETSSWLFGLPGGERWYAVFLTLGAVVTIFLTYKAEAPRVSLVYKLLLGALRLYLILLVTWFLLPQPQIKYDRQGFPDLVILIDTTRSMGVDDTFQDVDVIKRVKELSDGIRERLLKELPDRIAALETQIAAKIAAAQKDADVKADVDALRQRLSYWEKQRDNINASKWRPSRLQLAQALLLQPEPHHWLQTMLTKAKSKVHVFQLDAQGRATKLRDADGDAGDLIDARDVPMIDRSLRTIGKLEPLGNDSRLGSALKQVIDHYKGSGLSNVIMLTDGVTTRDETIAEAGSYAAQKGVPLLFVGIGDEQEMRDLKLHDMQVDSPIYLGDNAVFEVRLTGKGYKDMTVTVVLKVEEKNGKERELKRQTVKVDPSGQSKRLKFEDQPTEVGRRKYVIQVEPPKVDATEKPLTPANLRQERTVEVIDTKQINVLYVEGQPRYEFRYIKSLMEREAPDEKKKKKSIELSVVLLDSDDEWPATDKTALKNFPPTLEALNKYDVLIFGDCDPNHKKLQNRLKDIVSFVRGEDEKGKKTTKGGGGILFLAGAINSPHKLKGTPLADILPVEPLTAQPPREQAHPQSFYPLLTPMGMAHPMFRFRPDEAESLAVFKKLMPMYWSSTGYKPQRGAEVLAVHPKETAAAPNDNLGEQLADRHPLVVQFYPGGTGRSLFFGFDETWRWRYREDESKFNNFWIQSMRYLSRTRPTQTTLTLDRQQPYHPGDEIKISVTFPDSTPGGDQAGPKINDKTEVKVTVSYLPPDAHESKEAKRESEVHTIQLAKTPNSINKYDGKWSRTREGKYLFRLTDPDVSKAQPDGKKPSAEATVELPPGELDRLRMNYQDMKEAAAKSGGEFFTLANANEVLTSLRPGPSVPLPGLTPPTLLWNQWWVFVLVLVLITSEWVLRKLKHLL